MKRAARGLLIAALIVVLWFVAFYVPVQRKIAEYETKTAEAQALHDQILSDEATQNQRQDRERSLINTVGYTRPTTEAEQVARMVEQIETACVLAGVGLLEVAPMEMEEEDGPTAESSTGATFTVGLLRHPLQIQVIGELEGTVSLISWLRQTNPMMLVDRLVLTRDEDGLVRMSAVVSSWRPDLDTIPAEGSA